MMLHGTDKGLTVTVEVFPVLIAVFLHSCQKPGHRLHKSVIVHNRIPLITQKPALRISVVFCKDHRIRISLFYRFSELFPEMVVKIIAVSQICSHIQSPSIYVIWWRNPFPANIKDCPAKFLRSFVIQLRQSIMGPPAVIGGIIWPAILILEAEERTIRAVRRNIGSFFVSFLIFIDPFSVHPFIKRSTVVKYPVQDHFHSSPVDLFHKLPEKLVAGLKIPFIGHTADILKRMAVIPVSGAQKAVTVLHDLSDMRIDMIIVLAVIFVVAWGNKHRIQIDHIHPKFLEIIQFIHNSLKITAIKFPYPHDCRNLSPVIHFHGNIPDIGIFSGFHIVGRVSVIKAVHINLVHDSTLQPFRHMIIRIDLKFCPFLMPGANTICIIIAGNKP